MWHQNMAMAMAINSVAPIMRNEQYSGISISVAVCGVACSGGIKESSQWRKYLKQRQHIM